MNLDNFKNLLMNVIVPGIFIAMIIIPPIWMISSLAGHIHSNTPITTPVNPTPVNPVPVNPTPVTPKPPTKTTITVVQFGSHKTEAEAVADLKSLNSHNLFDVTNVRIYKATLSNGVWYRVALPVSSVSDGNKICDAWKNLGNDCLVITFNA